MGEPTLPPPPAPSRAPQQMDILYDQDQDGGDDFDQQLEYGDETW